MLAPRHEVSGPSAKTEGAMASGTGK
jgi:hypothetical protein